MAVIRVVIPVVEMVVVPEMAVVVMALVAETDQEMALMVTAAVMLETTGKISHLVTCIAGSPPQVAQKDIPPRTRTHSGSLGKRRISALKRSRSLYF